MVATAAPAMPCPICGGRMWDNRAKKESGEFKPSAPDYKCRDTNCEGVIWPEKEKPAVQRPQVQRPVVQAPAAAPNSPATATKPREQYAALVEWFAERFTRVADANPSLPRPTWADFQAAAATTYIQACKEQNR